MDTKVMAWGQLLMLFATGFLLSSRNAEGAGCVPPPVIEGYSAADGNGVIVKTLSVRTSLVSRQSLRCLGQKLQRDYRSQNDVQVLIFGDPLAAKHWKVVRGDFDPTGRIPPFPRDAEEAKIHNQEWMDRQLIAIYTLNRDGGQETIRMTPFGWAPDSPYDTIIDLRVPDNPVCRLKSSGRCVIAISSPTFPYALYKTGRYGEIDVVAAFDRSGKPLNVRVVADRWVKPGEARALMAEIVTDLKTWRLEASDRMDTIRVTFAFSIDKTVPLGKVDVQFNLPTKIQIRAHYEN